jgi:hypothetical protein
MPAGIYMTANPKKKKVDIRPACPPLMCKSAINVGMSGP